MKSILSLKDNMNKGRLKSFFIPESDKSTPAEGKVNLTAGYVGFSDQGSGFSWKNEINNIPIINSYWLVGFIEGEGCFTISKINYQTVFSLTQSVVSTSVLIAIDNFLKELSYKRSADLANPSWQDENEFPPPAFGAPTKEALKNNISLFTRNTLLHFVPTDKKKRRTQT